MKYIKTYNENKEDESKFDINFTLAKIKEKFPENKYTQMFDNEWPNWIDSDWEEDGDYDSDYDWYVDHNNREAEDIVLEEIIEWYKTTYQDLKSEEDESALFDALKDFYK